MPRRLLLAVALLAAPAASAQAPAPVFGVTGAAGDTLLAVHDDGPLSGVTNVFHSRSQVYQVMHEITLTGTFSGEATAFCEDRNDLPVSGECFASTSAALALKAFYWLNPTSSTFAAGYRCRYQGTGTGSATFQARALCLRVPGTGE